MPRNVRAVYHNGVFIAREFCDLPDGSKVELIIQGPAFLPPEVKGNKDREHILRAPNKTIEGIANRLVHIPA
jgi:predicted DNA-binding antitoxin AbrB/MazE fold protein